MGAAYFYHLTHKPLERTLPLLVTKALAAGWSCQIIGTNADRMEWLDQVLWLGDEAAFLPHGQQGGPHDADQPVLLATERSSVQDAQCVFSVDGAELGAPDVQSLERVCILFDGTDEQAVQCARGQWKALTDAGCAAQYWSEESGSWEMKASREAG